MQRCTQVEPHQYYNLSLFWEAGLRLGQAEEKLKHEKFSGTTRAGVLPARCLRGKVLFNFVWFDVKLASCHFHPVFFVGRVCCLAPCCSEQYLYYPYFLVNALRLHFTTMRRCRHSSAPYDVTFQEILCKQDVCYFKNQNFSH